MEYVRQLENGFSQRKTQNPNYSLRAYARDLALNPSTLSKIMKGQRGIPLATLDSLARRLKLNPEEKEDFFSSALQSRGIQGQPRNFWPQRTDKELKNDLHFKIISEWEYYAFLNLLKLKAFRSEPLWISDRLGISVARCKLIIEHLLKMGFIEINSEKEYIRVYSKISSTDEVSSVALKIAHQNDLRLAASRLWTSPVEQRDFYSMVLPINPKNLKKAKLLTRSYVKQLEDLLEQGDLSEVYQLSVQLFPITTSFRKNLRGRK